MPSPSLHDFQKKLDLVYRKIDRSDMPTANKTLLRQFDRYLVVEGLSAARRWKLLEYLHVLGTRYLRRAFRNAKPKDIWDAVFQIESSDLAPWTKHDFKVAIRKLFKFAEWGNAALSKNGYPDSVAGISIRIKKKDQIRIRAADILTEDEVDRLLGAPTSTQSRALLSLMYELGARVGEIGSMTIGDVSRDRFSYVCDLNGKTGPRSVRVIRSAAVLTAWLNAHPRRDDPASPLWGTSRRGSWQPVRYHGIQREFKRLRAEAGIKKRVHPHLLRHSRITHVLAGGHLNEAQAKVFFGLVADSSMLATYAHLVSRDANDAVLRMHGLTPDRTPKKKAMTSCGMCAELNVENNQFCAHCGYALDVRAVKDRTARIDVAGDHVARFLAQPEIADAFRQVIREEVRNALGRSLPERSARLETPSEGSPRSTPHPQRRRRRASVASPG
ncbi:MAG: tyrosine-type recombinase/integrase [Phycisphaerales bacterium]